MKILVVTQYFWPENFKINDLCDALIERGHEVTVYTGLPNYPEGKIFPGYSFFKGPYKEMYGKINVIRVPLIPRGKKKGIQLIFNYFSYFIMASILAPFLVRGKFDKIFVHEPSPITVVIPAIVLRLLKKAPIFFWVQDLWPESLEATGMIKNKAILKSISYFVSLLYKYSDKILVTSKGFIPMVKALGVSDEKIVYFPQWAEPLFKNKPDSNFVNEKIPVNGFKIMFAGNIGAAQDFETIVEASKILKDKKNIYFLILGDGVMREWAELEIKKNNLEKNFIFLGRRPLSEMPNYYSKADVMLMSLAKSKLFSITVPAKLQSYLSSGKPILASMDGEGASLVNEARAGLAVDAGNPSALSNTILRMSEMNSLELEEMGKNAESFYNQNFERETLIDYLEEKFKEVKL